MLVRLNILATATITRVIMNAPQNEVMIMINLPASEKGTRSPKPTVPIVITTTHTDDEN